MEPLAAGQVLAGRFRLVRPLGQGGTGRVWLAHREADGRPVALKLAATADAPALLRAEFEQARGLVHPHIARVEELVEGPPVFLVSQYVAGTDVGALRGAGFRELLRALLPVAEALEYAHRRGVVHRDVKAANILRGPGGELLLADFGLGAATRGGTLPGMSPQQLAGEPPAAGDDLYAFGALLYDLLAGQPLFHPDVTPERICNEVPVIPRTDLAGEPLPEPLRRLLSGLLQKSAAARPPGMAAVRAALEEILQAHPDAAPGVVTARERVRAVAPAPAAARPAPPRSERRGLPAGVVAAGLAGLVVAAGVVLFYLPALVRERGPLLRAADPPPPAAAPPAATPVPVAVPQELLDAALGEFLRADEALRAINAGRWGGAAWTELRAVAKAADDAYRTRDAAAALTGYRQAAALARALQERAPAVRAAALRDGEAALLAGDQARAVAQFELALAVAPEDAAARRGLERARRLDQVLALMNQAGVAEAAGQGAEALRLYREAAALDPQWTAATAAVSRLQQAAARDAYETQMARGFAAQAARDLAGARAAFEAALRARPGDAGAAGALAQVDADQKIEQLAGLQAAARELEQQERWGEAQQRYEAALAADPNLAEARAGQERARARAELDRRLRQELANAERFNDDAVLARARDLLGTARATADPGPVLRQQVAELDRLLQLAVVPVRVTLESDNLTEVTVFKVGRLGAFANRTLQLRPGAYTAVGSRPGYRDVRRSFRVVPGSDGATVVVRCEEPI